MQYDKQLTISTGNSRRAMAWPQTIIWWSELVDRLKTPARSTETLDQYMAFKKGEQDDLKDVGGFVGGAIKNGGRRKADAVEGRDIVTLDLDNMPAGTTAEVLCRVASLECGYCVYSTRKHSEAAPRLRVLLPLARTVSADEYEPLARKLAALIDPTMAPFDPTTFEPHRLMFWPSCCSDSQYVHQVGDLPPVDPDGVLAMYTDWHNVAEWPEVPGVQQARQRQAAKQQDPLEKAGIVGAFCKTYDIYRAIETFIPDAYTATDIPGRLTYTGGSTTGGAVVYDDNTFLFSHHATDPASGILVNSFDLVRLHLYGDKDDTAKPGTPTNRLPSFEAMCRRAVADETVAALLNTERYEKAVSAFSSAPVSADADAANWMRLLDVNSQGSAERTLKNYKLIISHDPNLAGKIRLNAFTGRVDVVAPLPWPRSEGATGATLWRDTDTTQLRVYIEPLCGKASKNDIADAVDACAEENLYNPVQDYLNALTWDGIPRLDALFIEYLGAADTPYTRAVTRKSWVAAVARIMTPGIKYDTMPVLIGGQGRHKSSILAKMGGPWFSDSLRTFDGKEAMETIQGTWINEISEMQAMERSEVNAVKAFLSKQFDYYRAAYGRNVTERARQCVFFGTTNSRDCLRDATGGRRFWPVDIDVQGRTKNVFVHLDDERDQIWAEAVLRWRLGEPLHLPQDIEAQARIEQEAHTERHPWAGPIEEFVERKIPADWQQWSLDRRRMFWAGSMAEGAENLVERARVCAAEIWCEMLNRNKSELTQRVTREINQLLEKNPGWVSAGTPRRFGAEYGNQRGFERKMATD